MTEMRIWLFLIYPVVREEGWVGSRKDPGRGDPNAAAGVGLAAGALLAREHTLPGDRFLDRRLERQRRGRGEVGVVAVEQYAVPDGRAGVPVAQVRQQVDHGHVRLVADDRLLDDRLRHRVLL